MLESTRMHIKIFPLPLIFVVLTAFLIGLLLGSQIYKINNENSPSLTSSQTNELNSQNYTFVGDFESPFDNTKKLIVTGDDFSEYSIKVLTDDKKTEVMRAMSPYGFQWTRDSKYVAFTDHVVSNQDVVYIINVATGKYVQSEGETQFVQSQPNPDDYTHVYTRNIDWYDNNQLIVGVGGYPDSSDFRPKSHFFFIEADSGKIIRRIL